MNVFIPDTAYMDPRALDYSEGIYARDYLKNLGVPIVDSKRVEIECGSPAKNYVAAKRTVLITLNTSKKLPPCRPSADFQFYLSSSCPGLCEYCYLQTTQGEKPVIKVFVNIDEILEVIQGYIDEKAPNITTFECSSITDPIALEHLTGSLKKCIEYFGQSEYGRLRLVTKFDNVDSLLGIRHNKHTRFRFSVNTRYVINNFEHNTSSFEERINAARKIASSGYPIGFIIAPIMLYDNWQEEYSELFNKLKVSLGDYSDPITFELIQHRFTKPAKELILTRFPNTLLDMNEETRQLKWGPYGKFKYVYPKEKVVNIKEYITELINKNFEHSIIEYFT